MTVNQLIKHEIHKYPSMTVSQLIKHEIHKYPSMTVNQFIKHEMPQISLYDCQSTSKT